MYRVPIAGGQVERLTHDPSDHFRGALSPSGRELAYHSFQTGVRNIFLLPLDGSRGPLQLTRSSGRQLAMANWSPDGRTIAFVSPVDGRIGLVSTDSGPVRYVHVPHDGDPPAELVVYAPNGRELYYKSHDATGRASLWSIPTVGGSPRLLVRFDKPAWSSNRFDVASDGKRFYFTVEDRQSDVWVAEVARR